MADKKNHRYYLSQNTFGGKYFTEVEPDLEVVVGDETIKVHKLMLILFSPIFKTQLLECKQNENITVKCNNPKIFKILIDILSCRRTIDEIDEDMTIEENIELINLANFYNIESILEQLLQGFYECEIEEIKLYTWWKNSEYPPLKKYCLDQIYYIFQRNKPSERNTFLKTVTDGSHMEYFFENRQELIEIPEVIYYNIIYVWANSHTIKDNVEHNNIIANWKNKLISLIDIDKFPIDVLAKCFDKLYKDFGEEYIKTFVRKYNTNEFDVKKEIGPDCTIDKIVLHVIKKKKKDKDEKIWTKELSNNYVIIGK